MGEAGGRPRGPGSDAAEAERHGGVPTHPCALGRAHHHADGQGQRGRRRRGARRRGGRLCEQALQPPGPDGEGSGASPPSSGDEGRQRERCAPVDRGAHRDRPGAGGGAQGRSCGSRDAQRVHGAFHAGVASRPDLVAGRHHPFGPGRRFRGVRPHGGRLRQEPQEKAGRAGI